MEQNYFVYCDNLNDVLHTFKKLAVKYGQNGGRDSAEFNKLIQDYYQILEKDPKFQLLKVKANLREELLKVPDLIAGALLPDVNLEYCGTWLWVTGSTYEYRDKLKELGYRYSNNKKCWYWRPYTEASKVTKPTSMEYIRKTYGTDLEEAS